MAKNPDGKIVVLEQGAFPSEEPRGVDIGIPLAKDDVSRVVRTAVSVLRNFGHPNSPYRTQPTLVGFGPAEQEVYSFVKSLRRLNDVIYLAATTSSRTQVLMGNVAYSFRPADLIDSLGSTDDAKKHLLAVTNVHTFMFCVPLGDENGLPYLTFPPSRDTIELTPAGVKFLEKHLVEACELTLKAMQEEVDKRETLLACATWALAQKVFSDRLLYDHCVYKGLQIPTDTHGLLSTFRLQHKLEYYDTPGKRLSDGIGRGSRRSPSLAACMAPVAILDEEHSYRLRIDASDDYDPYFMHRPRGEDAAEREEEIQQFEQILADAGMRSFRVSELPKHVVTRVKREKNPDACILRTPRHSQANWPASFWMDTASELETSLVIRLRGYEAINASGRPGYDNKHICTLDAMTASPLNSSLFHNKQSVQGLRYTDWKKTKLPEGCRPVDEFLRVECELWGTWIDWILYSKELASCTQSWWTFLLGNYDQIKLKSHTASILRNFDYYTRWFAAAKHHREYVAALETVAIPFFSGTPEEKTISKQFEESSKGSDNRSRFHVLKAKIRDRYPLLAHMGSLIFHDDTGRDELIRYIEFCERGAGKLDIKAEDLFHSPKLMFREGVADPLPWENYRTKAELFADRNAEKAKEAAKAEAAERELEEAVA